MGLEPTNDQSCVCNLPEKLLTWFLIKSVFLSSPLGSALSKQERQKTTKCTTLPPSAPLSFPSYPVSVNQRMNSPDNYYCHLPCPSQSPIYKFLLWALIMKHNLRCDLVFANKTFVDIIQQCFALSS